MDAPPARRPLGEMCNLLPGVYDEYRESTRI
jgi:hypothetical protein